MSLICPNETNATEEASGEEAVEGGRPSGDERRHLPE